MNIYIPTLGRISKQRTWSYIPQSVQKRTWLVCPENERREHMAHKRPVLVCPVKGIASVRQWLVDQNEGKLCIVDDDMYFFRRENPSSPVLKKTSETDMEEMFERIESLLDQYPMTGVSARQGNDAFLGTRKDAHYSYEVEPGLVLNKRTCNMYGVQAGILRKHDIRFDAVKLMEDMHVGLSLIARGYDTSCITDFAWNQPHSGDPGGCSAYRDGPLQKEAAILLAQLHRPFVKVVRKRGDAKKGNEAWKSVTDEQGYRFDVRVDWTGAVTAGRRAEVARLV